MSSRIAEQGWPYVGVDRSTNEHALLGGTIVWLSLKTRKDLQVAADERHVPPEQLAEQIVREWLDRHYEYGLWYDLERRAITVDGRAVVLIATDWLVFDTLARHVGRFVSRHVLCMEARGTDEWSYAYLNNAIYRIRKKLDESRPTRYIECRNRVGYRLKEVGA
ncbi:MAG: winged helix-turn-helix domain-containing protein [bacterium]